MGESAGALVPGQWHGAQWNAIVPGIVRRLAPAGLTRNAPMRFYAVVFWLFDWVENNFALRWCNCTQKDQEWLTFRTADMVRMDDILSCSNRGGLPLVPLF